MQREGKKRCQSDSTARRVHGESQLPERQTIPLWVCVLVEVLYKRGQHVLGLPRTWDEPGHNHDSYPYPCSGNLQCWVAQIPTDISEWLGFGLSQNLPPIFSQCFDCGRNWDRPHGLRLVKIPSQEQNPSWSLSQYD